MKAVSKVSFALACALGMSAVGAQTVQRDGINVSDTGKATQTVAQAPGTAPIQTAQAGGGASGGASTAGATAGAAGATTGAMIAVGVAAGVVAVSANNSSTVTH